MADVSNPGLSFADVQAAMDALPIPTPAKAAPPAVSEASTIGDDEKVYALSNHTHASKVRKIRVTTAADGTYTWTFSPPFAAGVTPIVLAVAEAPAGVTDVINAQIVGQPTNASCRILINRTQRSAVALLGLTILSVPPTPGATLVHAVALEP